MSPSHAFIGWFLCVPRLGLEPVTQVHQGDTPIHCATQPGQDQLFLPRFPSEGTEPEVSQEVTERNFKPRAICIGSASAFLPIQTALGLKSGKMVRNTPSPQKPFLQLPYPTKLSEQACGRTCNNL